MFEAVTTRADEQDIIIKAAAVGDYTPAEVSDQKVKKKDGDLSIAMKRTKDILMHLGRTQARRTVPLRVFHGDREYAGKFKAKLLKEKRRHDCSQQSERRRSRLWHGHQPGYHDHKGTTSKELTLMGKDQVAKGHHRRNHE